MRTISIVSQKGGCGKTTTAINMAAALAQRGKRVLLVDFDPQAHVTMGLGYNPDSFKKTIYDAITSADVALADVIVRTGVAGLDLVPCNLLLASADVRPGGEAWLRRSLKSISDKYDLCVVDCPPSLGVLTLSAAAAGTDIIIPVHVLYYTAGGLTQLFSTIRIVRSRARVSVRERIHLLLTFVDERPTFSRQVQRQVRKTFAGHVLRTVIHRNIKLAEAPGAGVPVLAHAPRSRGAAEYGALAGEILRRQTRRKAPLAKAARRKTSKQLDKVLTGLWGRTGKSASRRRPRGRVETT
jgi:chromosome partitioning protein